MLLNARDWMPGAFPVESVRTESLPLIFTRLEDRKFAYELARNIGWYERGYNHREEGDVLLRDIDDPVWMIEIGSLEELAKLAQEFWDKDGGTLTLSAAPHSQKVGVETEFNDFFELDECIGCYD